MSWLKPAWTPVTLALVLLGGCATERAGPATVPATSPLAYVDPMIGTGGDGHTFPGATMPFGMVQLSPSNNDPGWKWAGGYHYSDSSIKGFAHTHISGAGLSTLGDILFMPARGPSTASGTAEDPDAGYRSRFSHGREEARAGYYRVHLDDPDIDVELTAASRVGFHRYTYNGQGDEYVIVDPVHAITDHTYETAIELVSPTEIRGHKRAVSQTAGDRTVHFVARFSHPIVASGLTDGDAPVAGTEAIGKAVKAWLKFDLAPGEKLEASVALSHVDMAGALANFADEGRGVGFDRARDGAERAWQDVLSRVAIETADASRKRIFYTGLYHAFIAPTLISDVDGRYYLDGKIRRSAIPQFSNFSSWDTYRAQAPLLTLLDREMAGQTVASMVSRHAEAGLPLPMWEAIGNDARVMIGYPLAPLIADALLKDLPGVDPGKAYAAIRAAAFERDLHSNVYDASGMHAYLVHGFVPADFAASVAKTTEQNFADWTISRVAQRLGKSEDAALFAHRATGWRQHFDPASGDLLPRGADGAFVMPDRRDWASLNMGYVSGNIWAYSTYTPHDMRAAIRLHGGRAGYARYLEGIFTDEEPIGGEQHVDLSGFIGRYGHGDEPGHHMAYLFNHAGQPWRTQYYVDRILREMYSDRPDGLVNNEDLGQMSAWYVFGALGFYPVAPGSLIYEIGAPHVERATIRLGNGKSFTVEAEGLSAENIYIQSATLDGASYDRSYLTHDTIMAGGTLHFVMGSQPSGWGAVSSLGTFEDTAPVDVAPRATWAPHPGIEGMLFAPGEAVGLGSRTPGAAIRYTLDGSDPDANSAAYRAPIALTGETTLKAVAMSPDLPPSSVFERTYYPALTTRLRPGFPRIAIAETDVPYGRADGAMLVDRVTGSRFYGDRRWTGRKGDITLTLDLGQPVAAHRLLVGSLEDPWNGIMPASTIEVWGGDGPDNLRKLGEAQVPAPEGLGNRVHRSAVPLVPGSYRYLRVVVKGFGDMPAALQPPGVTSWLFLDEVIVQ